MKRLLLVIVVPLLGCDQPLVHAVQDATLSPAVCGDGVVQAKEACDDGLANDDREPNACREDCSRPRCGDAVRDSDEECDDGNDVDFDGCNVDCTAHLWTSTPDLGEGGVDGAHAVEIDSHGNLLVAGFVQTADAGQDAFVTKLDANGREIWMWRYVQPGNDAAWSVDVDTDDNVVVAGTLSHQGAASDAFVVELDPSGDVLWTWRLDSPGSIVRGVTLDEQGYIWLAGVRDTNLWVARLSPHGELVWEAMHPQQTEGLDIAVDASAAAWVASEAGLLRLKVNGTQDVWTAVWEDVRVERLDLDAHDNVLAIQSTPVIARAYAPDGVRIWTESLPYAIGLDIRAAPNGDVLIAGAALRTGEEWDTATARLDARGNVVWSQTHAGAGHRIDLAFSVAADPDGNVIAAGITTNRDHDQDVWIRKYMP